MTLIPDFDLRMFPGHWVCGFALETPTDDGGVRRSVQIFDAAGDAMHRINLRPASDLSAWSPLCATLALPDQSDAQRGFDPRVPVDAPRGTAAQAPALREGWNATTDTHRFLPVVKSTRSTALGLIGSRADLLFARWTSVRWGR